MSAQRTLILLDKTELMILTKLMERDEAKKVLEPYNKGYYGLCPECRKICSIGENFCSNCGQRLRFEVEK